MRARYLYLSPCRVWFSLLHVGSPVMPERHQETHEKSLFNPWSECEFRPTENTKLAQKIVNKVAIVGNNTTTYTTVNI